MLESRSLFAKRRRNVKEAIFMADKLGLSTGEVVVKDNNLEKALKRLKRKLERAGLFKEMKRRRHYEKPSERRRRKKQEAERRRRKKSRKDSEVA